MSREEELEREWRQAVTTKLNSIDETVKQVELSVATLVASRLSSRISEAEKELENLRSFKTKVVATVVAVQVVFGVIVTLLGVFG